MQGDGIDGAHGVCHILSLNSVPPRHGPQEFVAAALLLIHEGDIEPVDLQFAEVRTAGVLFAEGARHLVHPLLQFFVGERIAQRLLRREVPYLREFSIKRRTDALGGGIRGHEVREFLLQRNEFLLERIAHVLGDICSVLKKVGTVELPDLCFELLDALRSILFLHRTIVSLWGWSRYYSDLAMICAASALFTPSSGRNVPVGRPSAPLSPETTLFVAASAMSAS